ncbi:DUF2335 domain-containing protein [Candidatus Spongiisocius sp.]|uniref:DUF2335 domain-containing protein n=1 Tax=Candidatus Spongiisocius sp. TaxID=3101273 RepID=UPI003B595352
MNGSVGDGDLVPDESSQADIQPPGDKDLAFQEFEAVRFIGPLPPPEVLSQYEGVLPGLADRIVAMAESNTAHIQRLDQETLKHDSLRSFAGLTAGFIITIIFGIIAYRLIIEGHTVPGLVLGSIELVALVTVFVLGRRPSV